MATIVGVGKTTNKNAAEAGKEIAMMALENLQGKEPCFAFLYGTIGYDQKAFLQTVRDIIGPVPLVGGTFEGLISQNFSNESKYAGLLTLVYSDTITISSHKSLGDSGNGASYSEGLLENIQNSIGIEKLKNAKALVFFLDVIRTDFTTLLNSIHDIFPKKLAKLGIGTFDDFKLQSSFQYFNDEILSNSLVAALWEGGVDIEMTTCHGCVPLGVEYQVTRAEKNNLMELDNRNAISVIERYVSEGANQTDELVPTDFSHLIVGKALSKPAAQEFGDPYITLHPVVIERGKNSLFLSASINPGNKLYFMRRDPEHITKNLRKNARKLASRQPGKKPLMVFDCNCTARGRIFFGEEAYEKGTLPAQEEIGREVPWLGSYCFGEIAPVDNELVSQGYTEILLAVYEEG